MANALYATPSGVSPPPTVSGTSFPVMADVQMNYDVDYHYDGDTDTWLLIRLGEIKAKEGEALMEVTNERMEKLREDGMLELTLKGMFEEVRLKHDPHFKLKKMVIDTRKKLNKKT